jgi:hypothetical protein
VAALALTLVTLGGSALTPPRAWAQTTALADTVNHLGGFYQFRLDIPNQAWRYYRSEYTSPGSFRQVGSGSFDGPYSLISATPVMLERNTDEMVTFFPSRSVDANFVFVDLWYQVTSGPQCRRLGNGSRRLRFGPGSDLVRRRPAVQRPGLCFRLPGHRRQAPVAVQLSGHIGVWGWSCRTYANLPSLPSGWDGSVSICITRNPVDATAAEPYLLWAAIRENGVHPVWVGCARLPASWTSARNNNPPALSFSWKQVDTTSLTAVHGASAKLHKRPNGIVRLAYLHQYAADNATTTFYGDLSGSPAKGITYTPRLGESLGVSDGLGSVAYSFGNPVTQTTSVSPLPQVTVPVSRTRFYVYAGDAQARTETIGTARRNPLPPTQVTPSTQKYPLIGIIEGTPPVPNENVKDSFTEVNVGSVIYGNTQKTTTETSYKTSLGVVWKAQAQVGVPIIGSADMETEGSVIGNIAWNQGSEATMMRTYTGLARTVKPLGSTETKIVANGTAFLLQSGYYGFIYDFLDPTGNLIPGADSYMQLFQYQAAIVPYTFSFNPNATSGIIPGELQSYLVDGTVLDALAANSALGFSLAATIGGQTQTQNYLEFGWSTTGTYGEEGAIMNSNSFGGGLDIDASLLVGGQSGSEEAGDFAKGLVGMKVGFSFEKNTTASTETNFKSEVDTPAAPAGTPGAYQSYTYRTFILKENNQSCQDLINLLRSYNDPDGNNQKLLSVLLPESIPWKVTYAIRKYADGTGDYSQSTATGTALGAAAPAPIPPSLQRRGITTSEQAAQLHAAQRYLAWQQANPVRAARNRTRKPGNLPPDVLAVANQLSPQEKADLAAYARATHQQAFDAFRRRHPNWKGRTFPDPKTNALNLAPTWRAAAEKKAAARSTATPASVVPVQFHVPPGRPIPKIKRSTDASPGQR